jgi:hypothetical protein
MLIVVKQSLKTILNNNYLNCSKVISILVQSLLFITVWTSSLYVLVGQNVKFVSKRVLNNLKPF